MSVTTMKHDKLDEYKRADAPLPEHNVVWPTYGAGFENFGRDERPIETPLPPAGADELIVRHDACGLCFSDIKIISLGEQHPRIFRDIRQQPVVQGHEVAMTVVEVGDDLRDQYHVGDRFIIQADIFKDGVGYAYGYMIQGGLSRYGVIDQRVLNGDDGNYLLPLRPETGYAQSALVEPWACVIAAYQLGYRAALKPGVMFGIVGTAAAQGAAAMIGFLIAGVPAVVLLGFATFFLSMIPIGPPLIWGGAAIWLYNHGETGWAIFLVLYGLFVISSIDNFLKPFLIARGAGISILLIALGVIGGVLVFGFIGIFLGPVLLALGHVLAARWTEARNGNGQTA